MFLTITFDSNGGSDVAPTSADNGSTIDAPAEPTKDGHAFAGWFADEALTNEWNFETDAVIADITLYAAWTEEGDSSIKRNTLSAGVFYNGNGTFTIDVAGGEAFNVTVVNMQGQVVMRETARGGRHTVNIGNQPKGVYVFVVDDGKEKTSVKGIKK